MIVSMIVAAGENNVIGKDGDMPWRLPKDFKYFKQTTIHHPMVMGRKTWVSLGGPLPERTHIVVTRQEDFRPEGAEVYHSLEKAINFAKTLHDEEIFIIGGGEIYKQGMKFADRIYLTRIHQSFEGDTRFPEVPASEWEMIKDDYQAPDERNTHPFSFQVFERKNR